MKPRFIDIGGKRYLWRDIVELRRAQLAEWREVQQPALFEMHVDQRPSAQRSSAGRYLEPSLFEH